MPMSIDFGDFIPSFSLYLLISLRNYNKQSIKCIIRYLNTSKAVKNSAEPRFNPLLVWKF